MEQSEEAVSAQAHMFNLRAEMALWVKELAS